LFADKSKGEEAMNGAVDEIMKQVEQESQNRAQTLERLVGTADASKVFSEPVTSGQYTVISAAEVASGGGFGSGMGFGQVWQRKSGGLGGQEAASEATSKEVSPEGGGGGGGGGGGAAARPVAVIVIGPEGVEVQPVVDVRRLAIAGVAGLAILGHFLVKLARIR